MDDDGEMISVKALRGFHEVVATGSVTVAAARLGVSQPNLSRQLAHLESTLGFALFHRDHGRLIPTQDAMLLFHEVGVSLDGLRRIQGLARDIGEFKLGLLKIVAPPSLTEGVLPDIVALFVASYPKVRMNVESRPSDAGMAMVATRAVDCGFLPLPLARTDLQAEPLFSCDSVCVMRSDNPLCQHKVLTPRLLRDEPLIMLGYGSAPRTQIEAAFAREGIRVNARLETHTVGSACAFAARGLGVTLVNHMLAKTFLRPGLEVRKFAPRLGNDYGFVTAAAATPNRLTAEFLKTTKQYFASLGPL